MHEKGDIKCRHGTDKSASLCAHSLLLGGLSQLLLLFFLEIFLLSLGIESVELRIALRLPDLVTLQSPLLGLFFIGDLLDLLDGLFTNALDLAQDFGPEVGGSGEVIG